MGARWETYRMSAETPQTGSLAAGRFRWPAFPKPAPIEWICLVGGLFLTIHYSWLMDDAFIYFRYVDNLLYLHYGLVFNAGEHVEGFSSPLWMLLLIALRVAGLNFWIITRLVGVLAFTAFWMLLVVINRRLSPARGPIMNFPLCFLAFNYGVLCYFTSGLETPLVQVSAALYALWVLNPGALWLQALLALTPILRPELCVPFAMGLIYLWSRQRKFPWQMALLGLLITGDWLVFRIYYYADLLPNTFYLKNEVDFTQGLLYLQDTAKPYWLYPVLCVFLALTLLCSFWKRPGTPVTATQPAKSEADRPPERWPTLEIRKRLLLLGMGAAIALYVVKIGGDPRHYRFLAFPFCIWICACAGMVEQFWARLSLPRFRAVLGVAGVVVALLAASFRPLQLTEHPFFGGDAESEEVNKIRDAERHRHRELLPTTPWGKGSDWDQREEYAEFLREHPDGRYARLRVSGSCADIYVEFDKRAVQDLGLTEPILARTEMASDRPAHKLGLRRLAKDLARIISAHGYTPYPGMYRDAVERGRAPEWIVENLPSIEIIEQKELNRHHFCENLRLAFTFPDRIKP